MWKVGMIDRTRPRRRSATRASSRGLGGVLRLGPRRSLAAGGREGTEEERGKPLPSPKGYCLRAFVLSQACWGLGRGRGM